MTLGHRRMRVAVATLLTGTVIAHALTFAFSLLMTRVYDAESFGTFTAFMGSVAIVGILSTGGFDKAIVFLRSRRRLVATAALIGLVSIGAASAVVVLGAVGSWLAPDRMGPFAQPVVLLSLAVAAIGYAATQVYTLSELREGRNLAVASARVGQSLIAGVVQLLLGVWGVGAGLVAGQASGLALGIVLSVRSLRGAAREHSRTLVASMRGSVRRLAVYPRSVCPAELVDAIANQAPVFLIGAFYSLEVLGQYGLAQRTLGAPAALLGQAVGQSFLQRISESQIGPREIKRLMIRIWAGLSLLSILPLAALLVWGPSMFGFVFGETWEEAGRLAQYSSVLWLVRFTSSPTSTIAYKLGLQREQLLAILAAGVVRTAPYAAGAAGLPIRDAIVLHTVGELAVIVGFNFVALRRLRAAGMSVPPAPRSHSP